MAGESRAAARTSPASWRAIAALRVLREEQRRSRCEHSERGERGERRVGLQRLRFQFSLSTLPSPLFTPSVRPPRHPFALDTPTFSFKALAALAARAPIGSARDIAI